MTNGKELHEGGRVLVRIRGKIQEAKLLRLVDADTRSRALVQFDDGSQETVETYALEPAPSRIVPLGPERSRSGRPK